MSVERKLSDREVKQYLPHSVKAEGERKHLFTITTGAVDRDRDVVKPEGIRLENYRKNPVVLWAHRSSELPIGKAESIITTSGAIKARVEYVPAEMNPLAESVRQMVDAGFIRATSIGFLPVKYMFNAERGGFDIDESELLEFSICPVPANPEALRAAKDAGIDVVPVTRWAEDVLGSAEPGMWVPSSVALEAIIAAGKTAKSITVPDLSGVVVDAMLAVNKRGRVFSSENEERLRSARGSSEEVHRLLGELISQVEAAAPEEEPAPVEPAKAAEPVLLVTPTPKFLVRPEVVKAAVTAAVFESVRDAVNAVRGRLD